jgi:hypothetical protein
MLLTRILQLATAAISVPGRGRVELGFLKRMCTSTRRLLLFVDSYNSMHSTASGLDSASSLGLLESSLHLRLLMLEVSEVVAPQQSLECSDECAVIAS